MKYKTIALISGGLDSLLAAKVIADQDIEVIGVCFVIRFAEKDTKAFEKKVKETAAQIGIPVRFVDISEEFLTLLNNPAYGFGANMNPCIDCKILMLGKAKEIMKKEKASFVVTGEVLGERPMSQNKKSLDLIKKESGLEEFLLRPLSAKRFSPTAVEEEGIVDREALLDIEGRSRTRQIRLAKEYGIKDYLTPAGGCLLTDPIFSNKLKELKRHEGLSLDNIELLKYGRHFRVDKRTKIIIGRNEHENNTLKELKKEKDTLLRLKDAAGPYALIKGGHSKHEIELAGAIAASYSKSKNKKEVSMEFLDDKENRELLEIKPMEREETDKLLIG